MKLPKRSWLWVATTLLSCCSPAIAQIQVLDATCLTATAIQPGSTSYTTAVFTLNADGKITCAPIRNTALAPAIKNVYTQAEIDDIVKRLEKNITALSGDAMKSIKKAIDGQALKADQIADVINTTREILRKQLIEDLKGEIARQVTEALKKNPQQKPSN